MSSFDYRALVLLTAFKRSRHARPDARADPRSQRPRARGRIQVARSAIPTRSWPAPLSWSLQTEESEFVRPGARRRCRALSAAITTVQRAMIGEIGGGLDFFRSAVIEALGRHRARHTRVDGIAATSKLQGPLQDDALLGTRSNRRDCARRAAIRPSSPAGHRSSRTDDPWRPMSDWRELCARARSLRSWLPRLSPTKETDARSRECASMRSRPVAQNRNEAALSALFRLAKMQRPPRERRRRLWPAWRFVSLTGPSRRRLNAADGPTTRKSAITMLKDGFDSLEEDFDRRAVLRIRASRGYWRAPDGSASAVAAATLIQTTRVLNIVRG